MTIETFYKKIHRYLSGAAKPAESSQIQHWLSCIDDDKKTFSTGEREVIEKEILAEIQAYTAYPLFFPKKKL